MRDSSDLANHARKIHFTLVLVCLGLMMGLIFKDFSTIDIALTQAQVIKKYTDLDTKGGLGARPLQGPEIQGFRPHI